MRKINLACCLMAALSVTAMTQKSDAQRPAHYYPARPTFSAYLLYSQFNGTGIPNYYSYVRPETQFRDFVVRREETGVRQGPSVGREVTRALETHLRQRTTTGIGQPAIHARFGDTSHFYPQSPLSRVR